MLDPSHPIVELLRKDSRYTLDAYAFVFDALSYAQNVLEMGTEMPADQSEPIDQSEVDESAEDEPETPEQHVTGQDLCEAIRRFALEQFGYMAKDVLGSWGIHKTGDVGEIVFNLIQIGQMRKTSRDMRKDFDDVYDFDVAFRKEFKINLPESK